LSNENQKRPLRKLFVLILFPKFFDMNEEKLNITIKSAELFMKYGVRSITMDDVAKHLGMSKKTIYKHFADKTDLIKTCVDYNIEHHSQCIKQKYNSDENAIDVLLSVHKMVNTMLKNINPSFEYDLEKYYPEIYLMIKEKRAENMISSISKNLEKGQKEGLYRANMDIEIITKLFVSNMESFHLSRHFTQEYLYSSKVFQEIFNYHIHGIASNKGIKYLNDNYNL